MKITVEATIHADIETVWMAWNTPEDIVKWNAASDDWHTVSAEVDLREGGQQRARMEAKDGSMGFDFVGTYVQIIPHELIEYVLEDGREVTVLFSAIDGQVKVVETFDAEHENSQEMQRAGWQAILDNFAAYVEAKNKN